MVTQQIERLQYKGKINHITDYILPKLEMNYKELQIKDISMFEHEFDEQIIYIEIAAKNGEQIYNTVRQLKETKNLENYKNK